MVKYSGSATKERPAPFQAERLDKIFAAIADPTRRAIIAELDRGRYIGQARTDGKTAKGAPSVRTTQGMKSVSRLAEPFAMSLPAVMKHVKVLEAGGLVRRRKIGRTVYCQLNYQTLRAAQAWFVSYEKFWNAQLDNLGRYLAKGK